jgi:membrane-bound ClpP family serine protease
MLGTIFLLLLAGILLVAAESLVAGGFLAVLGTLCLLGGSALCYSHYGALAGTVCLVVSGGTALVVGVGCFVYALRRLAVQPMPPVQPTAQNLAACVGQAGRVLTDLDPTGFVELDGKRLQARSESSEIHIPVGAPVEVIGLDSAFLVVRPQAQEA